MWQVTGESRLISIFFLLQFNLIGKNLFINTLELLHSHFIGVSVRQDSLFDLHPHISHIDEILEKLTGSEWTIFCFKHLSRGWKPLFVCWKRVWKRKINWQNSVRFFPDLWKFTLLTDVEFFQDLIFLWRSLIFEVVSVEKLNTFFACILSVLQVVCPPKQNFQMLQEFVVLLPIVKILQTPILSEASRCGLLDLLVVHFVFFILWQTIRTQPVNNEGRLVRNTMLVS